MLMAMCEKKLMQFEYVSMVIQPIQFNVSLTQLCNYVLHLSKFDSCYM